MLITSSEFVVSNSDHKKCPPPDLPEFAFLGRSNVGKSSLINMLCRRKNLAKISVSPGKTRLINHFLINNTWYLVDLPGYGYAKISKKEREKWEKMTTAYLRHRPNLMLTFLLLDLRLELQEIDQKMINWFRENNLPLALIFTKKDKVKQSEALLTIETTQNKLLETWHNLPPVFVTSSRVAFGRDKILNYIEETGSLFNPTPLL